MTLEDDIRLLCTKILGTEVNIFDYEFYFEYTCPLCYESNKESELDHSTNKSYMNQLHHKHDCPYLIAQDLMTGIERE